MPTLRAFPYILRSHASTDMSKRPLTAHQRTWLLEELGLWRRDAIVTDQQAQRITALYEGAGEMAERGRSRAVFVLMAAAATLVGLAALLLVGYNWQDLTRGTKLIVVLGIVALTHATGFSLRYRRNASGLSETVFFLGCLFYGAGIWLVAQAFHINSHYPDGIWWWAIGVLPFALCLETRLLHALLVALLALWAGVEVLNFDHLGAWLFGRWNFLPNGAYSLPLLTLPGILWAYRKQSVKTLALYVPLLAWWTVLQVFAWKLGSNPFYFVGSVGALLLVAAESHAEGSRFAVPYRRYGALLVGGVLAPLSFYDLNKHLVGEWTGLFGPPALLGLIALLVVLLTQRSIPRRQTIPLGLALLMAILPLMSAGCANASCADAAALLPTILVNVAMV